MLNPLGNQIYITQNMHVAANKLGNQQNRLDYAQVLNLQEVEDKDKEIQDIRPPEAIEKTDPDKEHEKHHEHDQQARSEKKEKKEEEEEPTKVQLYKMLDIKA